MEWDGDDKNVPYNDVVFIILAVILPRLVILQMEDNVA